MLITSFKPGRVGNRLLITSHLLYALNQHKSKHRVYLLFFDNYYDKFNFSNNDWLSRYPKKIGACRLGLSFRKFIFRISYILSWIFKFFPKNGIVKVIEIGYCESYNLSSSEFKEILESTKIIFLNGFWFTSDLSISKEKFKFKDFLSPVAFYHKKISLKINNYQKKPKFTIGLHIRQGDYANYLGGKFYYSLGEYEGIINQLEHPDTLIIICTDNKDFVNLFNAKGRNLIISDGDEIEDLFTLAMCDLIVAPPSSFSLWASLWNSIPLKFIIKEKENIILTPEMVFPYQKYFEIFGIQREN